MKYRSYVLFLTGGLEEQSRHWVGIWLGSQIDATATVDAKKFVAEKIVMNFQRLMTPNDSYAHGTQFLALPTKVWLNSKSMTSKA